MTDDLSKTTAAPIPELTLEPLGASEPEPTVEALIVEAEAVGAPALEDSLSEEERAPFQGKKAGDKMEVDINALYKNPAQRAAALQLKEDELAEVNPAFTLEITKIRKFAEPELNEEFFKLAFPQGNVTDEAGLDAQYDKMYDAYCRIFDRFDLTYKIVRADTGAMGGLLSEEYQAITNIGEDIVVGCEGCDFSSNLEITEVMDTKEASTEEKKEMELVETPNAKTIEEVAAFFGKQPEDFVKTLLYNVDGNIVAFCIPGDRELNETKALKALGAAEMELADFADVEKATGAKVGFAGPVGLNVPVYMDRQIEKMRNFIVGANKTDHHYVNVNVDDFTPKAVLDLCQVKEGDICPKCGAKLTFDHGIEVGNLFKLGTKYAKSMNLLYTDANNEQQPVWMGSYGIGLERCMAAIVEQHHDDQGIIWPLEVAPFKACIVPVQVKDETQLGCANDLYAYCLENKYDVLLDDRKERAGVKFKDMELIGVPYRITVGRGAKDGLVEWVERAKEGKEEISIEEAKSRLDAIYRQ